MFLEKFCLKESRSVTLERSTHALALKNRVPMIARRMREKIELAVQYRLDDVQQ
jgi:hypothetical protein